MPTKIGDVILYNVADIAKRLDTSESTVRRYIRNGVLKGRKMGRRWYVAEENIQAYFREFGITPRPPVDSPIEELPDQWPQGAPPSRPPEPEPAPPVRQPEVHVHIEPHTHNAPHDHNAPHTHHKTIEDVLAEIKPGLNIHSLVDLFDDDTDVPRPISLADLLGEEQIADVSDDWRAEIEALISQALDLKRRAKQLEETYGS